MWPFTKQDKDMTDVKQIIEDLENFFERRPYINVTTNDGCYRNLIGWTFELAEIIAKIKRNAKLETLAKEDEVLCVLYKSLEAVKSNYGEYYIKQIQERNIIGNNPITKEDIKNFLELMGKKVDLIFKDE